MPFVSNPSFHISFVSYYIYSSYSALCNLHGFVSSIFYCFHSVMLFFQCSFQFRYVFSVFFCSWYFTFASVYIHTTTFYFNFYLAINTSKLQFRMIYNQLTDLLKDLYTGIEYISALFTNILPIIWKKIAEFQVPEFWLMSIQGRCIAHGGNLARIFRCR